MRMSTVKIESAQCCVPADNEVDVLGVRLFKKDPTLWSNDDAVKEKILDRLGWLDVPSTMTPLVPQILKIVEEVRALGYTKTVLLGMGGSSLCPDVMSKVFGASESYPDLLVLDSTAPEAIRSIENKIDLAKTLFIPASKSGSTIETNVMFSYFYDQLVKAGVEQAGKHFIAITDPGSSLEKLAAEKSFLHCFLNPSQIGGRFSALSLFGLVPMALLGINIEEMLARVAAVCHPNNAFVNNAIAAGLWLGRLALKGCDKLTFIMSPKLAPLGDWIEQLVAESTGKEGKGVLPIVNENVPAWSDDRVCVCISLQGTPVCTCTDAKEKMTITLIDRLSIGPEFLRWEIITAAIGIALGVNPFDEPNVSESKKNTLNLLDVFVKDNSLPLPEFCNDLKILKVAPSTALLETLKKNGTAVCPGTVGESIKRLLSTVEAADYVTLSAFIATDDKRMAALAEVRKRIGALSGRPTTLGIGPRYLHSTGQLHKGGANKGVFIVLVSTPTRDDISIPGYPYSFGTLCLAQGLGDFASLDRHGRRAMLFYTSDVDKTLDYILTTLK